MKNSDRLIGGGLSVLCLALACVSCSAPKARVTAQDVAALAGTQQQPISLRAGFFISEDLTNFNYMRAKYGSKKSQFLTGVELQAIFEQAARRMFTELTPVTAAETTKDFQARHLDVIVSVGSINVDDNSLEGYRAFGERVGRAYVVAQWDITSAEGKHLFFTKANGQGEVKIPFRPMAPSTPLKYWKKAFVAAFVDHLNKASTEITASGWWKDTSWRTR